MRRGRVGGRSGAPWLGALLSWVIVWAGCTVEERHLGTDAGAVHQIAVTADTMPIYEPEDPDEDTIVLVEERVELPIRRPGDEERMALWRNVPEGSPYPRRPWVGEQDVRIEIDWVVHNLSSEGSTEIMVLFNGFNEFHEYVPWATGGAEQAFNNFSQWERRIRLGPGERRSGTIREDDTLEAARDLAVMAMMPPNFNLVVHPQTRGLDDPRLAAYRPVIVPGLRGFRMALRTTGGADVLLEYTVRLRDMGDKLAAEDEQPWRPQEPELLLPPPPEEEE